MTDFWSANAAAFSVVLCCGFNCHPTLRQKPVKPFCTDNCAFPVPLIFNWNRKIFTAFSPYCLSTKQNTSLKLWISLESEDSSGYSLFLCGCLFSMSLISCSGVEFLPLSLIFYFFAYLLVILPFVHTNDAGFCHAVKKGKCNFQTESFYFSHLYKKLLLWGYKNISKFNILVLYSHMYVLIHHL